MKKNFISPKIKKVPLQQADIIKTHGDNKKIKKYAKFNKYSDWKECIKKLIIWYKKNMIAIYGPPVFRDMSPAPSLFLNFRAIDQYDMVLLNVFFCFS